VQNIHQHGQIEKLKIIVVLLNLGKVGQERGKFISVLHWTCLYGVWWCWVLVNLHTICRRMVFQNRDAKPLLLFDRSLSVTPRCCNQPVTFPLGRRYYTFPSLLYSYIDDPYRNVATPTNCNECFSAFL